MAFVNGTKLSDGLIGTLADDQIFGLDGSDTLLGLDGIDTLDGGNGADFMDGGDGGDTYLVNNIGDIVRDSGSSGIDQVITSISYSLATTGEIERLILSGKAAINGTGNTLANILIGNDAANILTGDFGADTLEGRGGNDTLVGATATAGDTVALLNMLDGGTGNDTYMPNSSLDTVVESIAGAKGGMDTVIIDTSFALPANVENLILTNFLNQPSSQNGQGNELNNRIIGSGLENSLSGGLGNDTLDGGEADDILDGGGGADLMIGGAGHDVYYFGTGDRIQESIAGDAGGIDIVFYSGSAPFVLGANLEWASLNNSSLGTGNALDNSLDSSFSGVRLQGLAGNDTLGASGISSFVENTLDGGSGADQMYGSKGNDIFIVDNGNDLVVGGAGIDEIRTSLTVARNYDDVENYTFTGGAVSFAANGLGDNTLTGSKYSDTLICDFGNDVLFGGSGNDTLWGGTGKDFLSGDAGADRMIGGTGDDAYEVDNAKDIIDELVSGNDGKDTIVAHISLSLASTSILGDIEDLLLSAAGTAVNGTGNALNNFIMGNSSNNKLDGAGGADTLNGMSGNDTLVADSFDVVSGGNGTDTVVATASINLAGVNDVEIYSLSKGVGAISVTTGDNANKITGNENGNIITSNDGNDTIDGGAGNDAIDGGLGNDIIIGGAGDDLLIGGSGENKINVALGNDTVVGALTGLPAHDLISGFDGNAVGGQDFVSLAALFDSIGIAAPDRLAHVNIVDKGSIVEIRVDTSAAPGGDGVFDLLVATLQTNDAIFKGEDVLL